MVMEMREKSRCSVAHRIEYPRYSYQPSFLYDGYGTINSCNNDGMDLDTTTDWSYDVANEAPVWEQFLSIGDQKLCANVKNHKRKKQESKRRVLDRAVEENTNSGYSSSNNSNQTEMLTKNIHSNSDVTLPLSNLNQLCNGSSLPPSIEDETETDYSNEDHEGDCVFRDIDTCDVALDDSIPVSSSIASTNHAIQEQTEEAIALACLGELSIILGDASNVPEHFSLSNSLNCFASDKEEVSPSLRRSILLLKSKSDPSLRRSSRIIPRSAMKRSISTDISLPKDSGENASDDSAWKRSVSFSNLHIREYTSVEISDNPSCSNGPPIQLGWEYRDQIISVDVDKYEEHRSPRKTLSQMLLPYHVRRYLLLYEGGYSNAEVSRATREVERVKREKRKKLKQVVSSSASDVKIVRKDEDEEDDESRHPLDAFVGFLGSVFHFEPT